MAIYAVWNNKGGVGKNYLTFQVAAEYARIHPQKKVLVENLCPQCPASTILRALKIIVGRQPTGQLLFDVEPGLFN